MHYSADAANTRPNENSISRSEGVLVCSDKRVKKSLANNFHSKLLPRITTQTLLIMRMTENIAASLKNNSNSNQTSANNYKLSYLTFIDNVI